MSKILAAALVAGTLLVPVAAQAEDAAPVAAAKFTLDTPVEALVADAGARAVLDADLPGLTTHEHYEMFKGMSLNQLALMAPDKVTPELMAKVTSDLAALQ